MKWSSLIVYPALLALSVAVGALAGRHAFPLLHAAFASAPPAIADNSAYFRGEQVDVLMFGTETCPWCVKTRALFDELHVDYREHRIDASPEAKRLYETLDAQGVPVVLIGDRRIYGFDEAAIRSALETRAASPSLRASLQRH